MRTHKHTDLADSTTALIADLNRPGDLSVSLTHTQHTSFFPSLYSPSSLLAQISFAFSPCRFALFYFCPLYLPLKSSALVCHHNTGDDFLPRMLMAVFIAIPELCLTVCRCPCAYNRASWWEAQGNPTLNHLKHLS